MRLDCSAFTIVIGLPLASKIMNTSFRKASYASSSNHHLNSISMKRLIYIVMLLSACTQTPQTLEPDYSGTYTGLTIVELDSFNDTRAFKVNLQKQGKLPYKASYTISNASISNTYDATCTLSQDVMTCTEIPEDQSYVRTYQGTITAFTWSGTWDLLSSDNVLKGTFSVQR